MNYLAIIVQHVNSKFATPAPECSDNDHVYVPVVTIVDEIIIITTYMDLQLYHQFADGDRAKTSLSGYNFT